MALSMKKGEAVLLVDRRGRSYPGKVAYVNQHKVHVKGGRPGEADQKYVFNRKNRTGVAAALGWTFYLEGEVPEPRPVAVEDESFSDMKNDEALLVNGRPKEEPHKPTPEEQRDQLRVQAAEASWMVYVEWLCNRYGLSKEVRAPVSKMLKDLAIDEPDVEHLLGTSTKPVAEEETDEEEELAKIDADMEDEGGGSVFGQN